MRRPTALLDDEQKDPPSGAWRSSKSLVAKIGDKTNGLEEQPEELENLLWGKV